MKGGAGVARVTDRIQYRFVTEQRSSMGYRGAHSDVIFMSKRDVVLLVRLGRTL